MARAVHGLHRHGPVVGLGEVHVLPVVVVVAGSLPELDVQNLRRQNLLVAELIVEAADVSDELVVDDGALGMEKGARGCFGMEAEEIEVAAEASVITALCLLKHRETGLQLLR